MPMKNKLILIKSELDDINYIINETDIDFLECHLFDIEEYDIENKIKEIEPNIIIIFNHLLNNDLFKNITLNKDNGFIFNGYNVLVLGDINDVDKNILNINKIIKHLNKKEFNYINNLFSFKLPKWCYDENHILIDVQYIKANKEVLFIFRNKDGKKIYHSEFSNKNYYYKNNIFFGDSPLIENVDNLDLRFSYKNINKDFGLYWQDMSIELKHSVDYYFNRKKEECKYNLRKLFWDIEIFTFGDPGFPFPNESKYPINAISFKLNDEKTYVYILKFDEMDKTEINPNVDCYIEIFDNEKDMLLKFIEKVNELDVDIMCGWNTTSFDEPYFFNRLQKNGIDNNLISPIKRSEINLQDNTKSIVFGLSMLDQMILYKRFNQNEKESYKLSSIAQDELGKDKVAYEGMLDNVYEKDINKFIEYSCTDTDLLSELENKVKHIELNFELIKTCSSTWNRSKSTNGLLDPLVNSFAKNNNKVCKNRLDSVEKSSFDGAYVLKPIIGLHNWVIDLDFKSLYPSIICTFNIGHNTYVAKIDENLAKQYLYNFDNMDEYFEIEYDPIKINNKKEIIQKNKFKEYINDNDYIVAITGCIFKNHKNEISFLNEIVLHLLKLRDKYKKNISDLRTIINNKKYINEIEKNRIDFDIQKFNTKQMTIKVVMNALYGILSNPYTRLYNLDLAKTVTGTGQEVLKYSVSHLSKYMKTGDKKIDMEYLNEFENKEFPYIVYGDSVCKSSIIKLQTGEYTIEEIWNNCSSPIIRENGKETKKCDFNLMTCNNYNKMVFSKCNKIIKHKCNKKIYRVKSRTNNVYIDVTEDHSIICFNDDNTKLIEVKPQNTKHLLYLDENYNIVKIDDIVVTKIEYNDFVYDLSVPGFQKFFANNILVHNTDSLFVDMGSYLIDNNKIKV